jgi:hypothetical protein
MSANWEKICQVNRRCRTGFSNGGWAYDAYPELETLDAHKSITIANIQGPAVITCIHSTQHFHQYAAANISQLSERERRVLSARGIILEVYYNDMPEPSVRVPLGDFFADGCGGQAVHFSSLYVEKAPESYNCFIPMPFERSARVVLRNETPYNFYNYSFVEYEQIPEWDSGLGYFHSTWTRSAFQLSNQTDKVFFHINGTGHLLGRSWSICTAEPLFQDFTFIMEGNNEFRIDGEEKPRLDYLGTEDSFGFSWGFQKEFAGLYNGMNYIKSDTQSHTCQLSIYRFLGSNVIRFNNSLDLRLDWTFEFRDNEEFHRKNAEICARGGGWVDFATTYYWYQQNVGHEHAQQVSLEDRCKPVLDRTGK